MPTECTLIGDVFPAPAGINRRCAGVRRTGGGVPRASGDKPNSNSP
ncbi:TPA: hypothetical protein ID582_001454 [Escherichia coli]|nr:hypothetical protein [Escherichia coli]